MLNNNVYQDKVAIITGSSRGIGKALAIELASHGMRIVLNGRDRHKLHNTASEMRSMGYDVFAVAADIRYLDQCERLIHLAVLKYHQIDVVINNAALSSRGSVENSAPSNFEMLIDTNFIGSVYISKYAIPHLKKTKGHLVFINSIGGFRGMPYNAAYTASKMAQGALAQAIDIELQDDGVHVGIVYVGFTQNDPQKMILDVDGSWVYLPKRDNIQLASQVSVANSIFKMIKKRKRKITLTPLGHVNDFLSQYFPGFTRWLIRISRKRIKEQFTFIKAPEALDRAFKAKETLNPTPAVEVVNNGQDREL